MPGTGARLCVRCLCVRFLPQGAWRATAKARIAPAAGDGRAGLESCRPAFIRTGWLVRLSSLPISQDDRPLRLWRMPSGAAPLSVRFKKTPSGNGLSAAAARPGSSSTERNRLERKWSASHGAFAYHGLFTSAHQRRRSAPAWAGLHSASQTTMPDPPKRVRVSMRGAGAAPFSVLRRSAAKVPPWRRSGLTRPAGYWKPACPWGPARPRIARADLL
jgi:hypothetical protein